MIFGAECVFERYAYFTFQHTAVFHVYIAVHIAHVVHGAEPGTATGTECCKEYCVKNDAFHIPGFINKSTIHAINAANLHFKFSFANMGINLTAFQSIEKELAGTGVVLIAVSKTKPVEDIQELYRLGQRDFGENYVQELCDKYEQLPKDIRWHFIGHLQSNKVKYIAPFVHLIHGVDSVKLLAEIDKQAAKLGKKIDCLLQVHIAQEETKFGFDEAELAEVQMDRYANVQIRGLMGMASFTDDVDLIRKEFKQLKQLSDQFANHQSPVTGHPSPVTNPQSPITNHLPLLLSMGMSADYKIAIEEGSNMVRIGSLLFGQRNYDL
jgi:pyridoxal phosphate enzyme (YggS family)